MARIRRKRGAIVTDQQRRFDDSRTANASPRRLEQALAARANAAIDAIVKRDADHARRLLDAQKGQS